MYVKKILLFALCFVAHTSCMVSDSEKHPIKQETHNSKTPVGALVCSLMTGVVTGATAFSLGMVAIGQPDCTVKQNLNNAAIGLAVTSGVSFLTTLCCLRCPTTNESTLIIASTHHGYSATENHDDGCGDDGFDQ